MTDDEETEAARTLLGLVVAVEAGDKGAEAALWYGAPVPVRRLLAVACRMIWDLAGDLGDSFDPPETAGEVLGRIALDVAAE